MEEVEDNFEEGMEEEGENEGEEGFEEMYDNEEEGGLEEDVFQDNTQDTHQLRRAQSFDCLPQEEILKQSKSMIDDVKQLCYIPSAAAAATLLRGYK